MLKPGDRIKEYEIKEKIGTGGMATVFRAYQPSLNREIALKVLSSNYSNQTGVKRFIEEAKLAAKVEHYNVVPIYDVGKDKGHYFIAMKLINGVSLSDEIKKQGKIPVEEAIRITIAVCGALSKAQEKGVIHRDIKPHNIILEGDDVYVADFGIAKALNELKDKTSHVIGTPSYMSPERCNGHSGDIRSDIYSLGITIYQMLTGKVPFVADNPIALCLLHQEKQPDPLDIGPEFGWLNKVVQKCLAKKSEHRYQNPDELKKSLVKKEAPPVKIPWMLLLTSTLALVCLVVIGVSIFKLTTSDVVEKKLTVKNSPKTYTDKITGMEFVFVKGGTYEMGDTFEEGEDDENPVHTVTVSDFYIGKYEVTQGQWETVMGDNPSHFMNCGENCPVENVSWYDVMTFIRKLNSMADVKYDLPTEAEWEYVCRDKGANIRFGTGSDTISSDHANYDAERDEAHYSTAGTYRGKTTPVGYFNYSYPGELEVYDLSGNVWEWVKDSYDSAAYEQHSENNPIYMDTDAYRVIRGGSWYNLPKFVRCSIRDYDTPDNSDHYIGFRLKTKM